MKVYAIAKHTIFKVLSYTVLVEENACIEVVDEYKMHRPSGYQTMLVLANGMTLKASDFNVVQVFTK